MKKIHSAPISSHGGIVFWFTSYASSQSRFFPWRLAVFAEKNRF